MAVNFSRGDDNCLFKLSGADGVVLRGHNDDERVVFLAIFAIVLFDETQESPVRGLPSTLM